MVLASRRLALGELMTRGAVVVPFRRPRNAFVAQIGPARAEDAVIGRKRWSVST